MATHLDYYRDSADEQLRRALDSALYAMQREDLTPAAMEVTHKAAAMLQTKHDPATIRARVMEMGDGRRARLEAITRVCRMMRGYELITLATRNTPAGGVDDD